MKTPDIQNILDHYITCALWSSIDDNQDPMDSNYDESDIHPDTLAKMEAEIVDFVGLLERENVNWDDCSEEQFGHDFWLTRNGHGAGFWDRGFKNGDLLTKWAGSFGSCDLYVGDDGKIHI